VVKIKLSKKTTCPKSVNWTRGYLKWKKFRKNNWN